MLNTWVENGKTWAKRSDITLWDKNPRSITKQRFAELCESIKQHGQFKPIVVLKDGTAIGGNMRMRGYETLGIEDVWVSVIESEDRQDAFRIALRDNERFGYYEEAQLVELTMELEFDPIELKKFQIDLGQTKGLDDLLDRYGPMPDDDNVPELVKEETFSEKGKIYMLGEHRLMCGDSTSREDVTALMAGEKAQMVFTDPPYNVDYKGGMGEDGQNARNGIMNDKMGKEQFYQFLHDALKNCIDFCEGGIYVAMSSSELDTLKVAFEEAGGHWQSFIIWVKNNFTLSRSDYQHIYEPILYGWSKDVKNHYFIDERNAANVWEDLHTLKSEYDGEYTTIKFSGFEVKIKGKAEGEVRRKRQRTDIWRYDKPVKSPEHPTMKPLALVAEALKNSSKRGELVLDLFGGSGSTLIAAEETHRKCYMMELDPHYIDVIRKRWCQKAFGDQVDWQEKTPAV